MVSYEVICKKCRKLQRMDLKEKAWIVGRPLENKLARTHTGMPLFRTDAYSMTNTLHPVLDIIDHGRTHWSAKRLWLVCPHLFDTYTLDI